MQISLICTHGSVIHLGKEEQFLYVCVLVLDRPPQTACASSWSSGSVWENQRQPGLKLQIPETDATTVTQLIAYNERMRLSQNVVLDRYFA